MNRLEVVAAGAILTLALGACSSSGPPAASLGASSSPASGTTGGQTGSVGDSAATFHGTIQVTGATRYAAKYTWKDAAASNCTVAAAHGDMSGGGFEVPSPPAGQNPQIAIQVAGFHGVGTYSPSDLQKDKSDSIRVKTSGVMTDYELTSHPVTFGHTTGKEVLFLNNNGSGQLAFSEAHKLGQKSGPAIAGLINWTCTTSALLP